MTSSPSTGFDSRSGSGRRDSMRRRMQFMLKCAALIRCELCEHFEGPPKGAMEHLANKHFRFGLPENWGRYVKVLVWSEAK